MRTELTIQLQPAPSSPINLKLGVTYASRLKTASFDGYCAIETGSRCHVQGYRHGKPPVDLFEGPLHEAWVRLAEFLGMVE
jgi:hypothetical protein